jgi:hypothetical protein
MGRNRAGTPPWLALGLLLGLPPLLSGLPPARASLLLDFDTSRAIWRNDGDPTIEGRQGGESRALAVEAILAAPLASSGVLRFPPCRALPEAARSGCAATLLPAGEPGLVLDTALPLDLRQAYLPLWPQGRPLLPPEQEALAGAMAQLRDQLTGAILLRDLPALVEPLRQAALQAEAAAVAPALVARARRSERMVEVLTDLWRIRNALSSRDLSLPCDTLEQKARLFNQVAGEPAVRLQRLRPRGICLFCGNVCTPESADRLLADMKESLIRTLEEAVEPGQTPEGSPSP